jgi:hypothetical protein
MLVTAIYARARFFLNDIDGELFTDSIMLAAVQAANDELSDELIDNGIALQKEVELPIDVDAGDVSLDLPTDLIVPIKLWERAQDSEDKYVPMRRMTWSSTMEQSTNLEVWDWRNQAINLLGATTDREVRLDYIRMLVPITTSLNSVEVTGSLNYLSCKTAALVAGSIGGNEPLELKYHALASRHLNKLLKIGVKNNQANRSRRRPFRLSGVRKFF